MLGTKKYGSKLDRKLFRSFGRNGVTAIIIGMTAYTGDSVRTDRMTINNNNDNITFRLDSLLHNVVAVINECTECDNVVIFLIFDCTQCRAVIERLRFGRRARVSKSRLFAHVGRSEEEAPSVRVVRPTRV